MPQVGREVAEEVEAGRVGPVEVVEQEEGRAGGGELGEESPHLGEERGLVGDARQPAAGEGGRGRRAGSGRAGRPANRSSQGP